MVTEPIISDTISLLTTQKIQDAAVSWQDHTKCVLGMGCHM
jgi:hypothetical protein